MTQLIERYHFIHNVFASFFKDTLDWFSNTLYDRFEYTVIGTYDKAVEYIRRQCEMGQEVDMPMLPALILNPSGDFEPAESNAGGRQYWRYPNLSPSLSGRLFDPIYKDEHVIITPAFLRIKGEIELIMLLNSFYEYCDLRVLFINMFGGLERWIYPRFFTSFIILPESFRFFTYDNPYTGVNYQLDWDSAGAIDKLVKTISRNEVVLPLNVKPQYKLTGMSDASERYGGPDNIAEWKLNATLEYEIEIPNYLVINTDYLVKSLDISIEYDSVYSEVNDYNPPDTRVLSGFEWSWDLNETINTPEKLSEDLKRMGFKYKDKLFSIDESTGCYTWDSTALTVVGDFQYKQRYFYRVSEKDMMDIADGTTDLVIDLWDSTSIHPTKVDFPIMFPKILLVHGPHGILKYQDHYHITGDGRKLIIKTSKSVKLKKGMMIELFLYGLRRPDICET